MHRFLLLCFSLVCATSLSAQGKIRELLAAKAPELFKPVAPEALTRVLAIIQHPEARSESGGASFPCH